MDIAQKTLDELVDHVVTIFDTQSAEIKTLQDKLEKGNIKSYSKSGPP